MAVYTQLCRIAISGSRLSSFLHVTGGSLTYHSTAVNTRTLLTPPFQARSYANSASIFDEQNQKKYYIFGGKGGVGKTSCAASLAVKFADHGHPTILVSLNPTHSLRDSFDQDLTKGAQIRELKSSLYAIEINRGGYMKYFPGSAGLKDFMNTIGLGKLVEKFGESRIEKLLDSPSPGINEAVEISRLMHIAESPDCSMYTRVVIDTSSKGDDLLHVFFKLFDWEIRDETTALLSSLIETDVLREPIEYMKRGRELIRGSTEYVIVTTPSVMGVLESFRLHASLEKEEGLVRRVIVSEMLPPSSTDCKFCSKKREDEMLTLEMMKSLWDLDIIEVPLVDEEMIRGMEALKSMGDLVWK